MTNWSSSQLSVVGDKGELERFQSAVRGTDENGDQVELSFSSLLPEPDISALEDAPSNVPVDPDDVRRDGKYSWRVANWGTKWEATKVGVEVGPERVVYTFLTAWNTPLSWVREASGLFPELSFELEFQDEDSDEDRQGIYLRCLFRDAELIEADDSVDDYMRTTAFGLWLTEDPWLYYFFAHPEELARADDLMAGPPPDEIKQWIEVREHMEARRK